MTALRERLAKALHDDDPHGHLTEHCHYECEAYRGYALPKAGRLIAALGDDAVRLEAALAPGAVVVDVETFLRGLRSAVRRELSWGGMNEDERTARADLIDIEARRLLGIDGGQ